jgi:hypothetical protein
MREAFAEAWAMTAPAPLSPEEIEGLITRLSRHARIWSDEPNGAKDAIGKVFREAADALAGLNRQLAETAAQAEDTWTDLCHCDDKLAEARAEVERVTRERDEAYATVKRVWAALGCERYEDARGMHISELVEELRRDRDRYKALAEETGDA